MGQVADRGAFVGAQLPDLFIDITDITDITAAGRRVKLDVSPYRYRVGRNDLHRLVELVAKAGRQVRMPNDHRVHCIA
ncbi:hypothetical protein LAUMK191_05653 [Mycobacterium attenuatum]|uniref:Uncharacterized protein n=1 Tax=Mycobacterium attenuatum TaxID=2341086 RepID=A0A498QHR5_9MYCO|nr:hypothetical protein LAUMK136_05632 [Mycobacterium attenuatum]VBA60701.1 hypothetical protein LAUMK191_05653 [Mycobacterium attenuatum]